MLARSCFVIAVLLCAAVCLFAGDSGIPVLKPVVMAQATNKVPGLEISSAQTVLAGQRVAVVVASAMDRVEWDVAGGESAATVGAGSTNLLVFLSGKPETVTVTAWTVTGNGPSKKATTTITVPGPPSTKPVVPPFKLLKDKADKAKAKTELVPIEEKP